MVCEYIKRNHIFETLSYNVINRKHVLEGAINNKDIITAILRQVELTPRNEIPFLFPDLGD